MKRKNTMTEPLLASKADDTELELTVQPLSSKDDTELNVQSKTVNEYALSQIHSIFPHYEELTIQNVLLQNENDITRSINVLMDEEQRNTDFMLAKTLENQ